MSIPSEEVVRLEQAVVHAEQLAGDGQVLGGYDLLDLMLSWAESPALNPHTGEASPPEPWAEALIHRCRVALITYAAAHGVSFATAAPASLMVREKHRPIRPRFERLRVVSAALQHRSGEHPRCLLEWQVRHRVVRVSRRVP